MYLPLGITTTSCSHQTCMSKKRVSFFSIKKIPKRFHVIIEGEHPVVGTSDQCYIPTLPIHATSQVQRVWQRDSEMVVKVTAAMEMNPFTAETTNLINI